VTDRCNLRCVYCLPADGPKPVFLDRRQLLTFEQITQVARACADLGVHKIRLTGGEPLLRRDLPTLVAALAAIDGIDDLALTTNATLLADQAAALADAGLRRVTVSLDSLDPDTYARISGVGAGLDRVLAGIHAAHAAGLHPIKLNAVIRRGINDTDILPLARYARQEGLNLRLIEYMDVGPSNPWQPEHVVTAEELLATIHAAYPLTPAETTPGIVATTYHYQDGAGDLGIIHSVSDPFCADCTRARLTADGHLYTCLFAAHGHDLRRHLASGDHTPATTDTPLHRAITATWTRRSDRHCEQRTTTPTRPRTAEMHHLGG
jgi:cyclic pyranopterin phosphate synthase